MATALALMVLTTIALLIGAGFLWRRGGSRRQVILMLVLAAIIAANVALWALPTRSGKAPIDVTGR
jgi:hypothetical protein